MQTLTYITATIAIAVLTRAFFSWDNRDDKVSADTTTVVVEEESVILNEVNDPAAYAGQANPTTDTPPLIINEMPAASSQQPAVNIPNSINHEVIFFPQAPDGNRNLPRQEACEEASIALANYFIKGKTLTRDQFRADLLAMVDRQMEMFGDYIHTSVAQTKELYLDFYGGDAYIVDNPSIEEMKSILAQWHIIIAPFAGRKLGNPHYSAQGPWYHMLVIRGYDQTHFYTNDVWTSRGENFGYTHATIMDALHDLNMNDINQGAKRILVIVE